MFMSVDGPLGDTATLDNGFHYIEQALDENTLGHCDGQVNYSVLKTEMGFSVQSGFERHLA